jgi:hypothetical protein
VLVIQTGSERSIIKTNVSQSFHADYIQLCLVIFNPCVRGRNGTELMLTSRWFRRQFEVDN